MSFADSVRSLQAKKLQEFKDHRDAEVARLIPALVERIKASVIKHVENATNFDYFNSKIEFSDFGQLDAFQKEQLKRSLQAPPVNLFVNEDDYDGRAFWIISW
jgi:hypothetical protein